MRLVNSQHNGEKKESFLDFTRPEEVVFLRDWNSKMSRADWTRVESARSSQDPLVAGWQVPLDQEGPFQAEACRWDRVRSVETRP